MKKNLLLLLTFFCGVVGVFADTLQGTITLINDDGADAAELKFLDLEGVELSQAWVMLGFVNSWDGTSALTVTDITTSGDWNSVGESASNRLSASGYTDGITFDYNTEIVAPATSYVVALVMTGTTLGNSQALAALTFTKNGTDLLDWGTAASEGGTPGDITLAFGDSTYALGAGVDWYSNVVIGEYNSGSKSVTMSKIPEPSVFGVFAGILALSAAGMSRRRKNVKA